MDESFDRKPGDTGGHPQRASLDRRRHDRADSLAAADDRDATQASELVIEPGAGQRSLEQAPRDASRQPAAVERERLVIPPDPAAVASGSAADALAAIEAPTAIAADRGTYGG